VTSGLGDHAAEAALRELGVSREALDRLAEVAALVEKWTPRVNLIARSTRSSLWWRHIVDSAQIYPLAPKSARRWVDLGSGAGFPGLVCALLAQDAGAETAFALVESDRRKCAFLHAAKRQLGLDVQVIPARAEETPPLRADIISARALAPLDGLFGLAERHLAPGGILLLPKGAGHATEIASAERRWRFTVEALASITDPEARILRCRLAGRI